MHTHTSTTTAILFTELFFRLLGERVSENSGDSQFTPVAEETSPLTVSLTSCVAPAV
jgi:hypothetical protein